MQDYFFSAREKFLIVLKAKYFQQKFLNQNLNQQCLLHLNHQKKKLRNLSPNHIHNFWIKLHKMKQI